MVAVSPVGANQGLSSAGLGTGEKLESFSANKEASFSQAIQLERLPDVTAMPVSVPGMASHITAGLRDISSKLASWHVPTSAETAGTSQHDSSALAVPDNLTSAMAEAVSGLQGAYVFAIQATLVSRGSTEGTKILNTLLKGQ